jgi:hypothetical protein
MDQCRPVLQRLQNTTDLQSTSTTLLTVMDEKQNRE